MNCTNALRRTPRQPAQLLPPGQRNGHHLTSRPLRTGGTWRAEHVHDPDAQSPAGGVSSTVRDMSKWLRLQLGNGTFKGRQVVDADALEETHLPHMVSEPPHSPAGRTGFYGLGWNVSYDDQGRLKLGHSGGFALGAATNVALLPSEKLGIVVLTNGEPIGVPEAISATFLDSTLRRRAGRPSTG
ncbi:serine hydrolase domain-containing protein [Streptomyces rishiriensis]|uniref:serine hydrolase domain-containing protein n=1 Tax=Streptomyces rishiriensis TaxID=68264 RepID=UPI0033D3EFB4